MSTAKIVPLSVANQRVVGGKKQEAISNRSARARTLAEGRLGGEGCWLISNPGPGMQTGPRIYIPAKTHPHLGRCFVAVQLATPKNVTPARGITVNVYQFML
jgi:hypothetical protein